MASGAAGLGLAHAVAALTVPAASPLLAVGSVAIDAAPTPVKEFAVRTFGDADKLVLLTGMSVVLIVVTAVIGVLGYRARWVGIAGMASLSAVAGAAAYSRSPELIAVLPALVAAVVAIVALTVVLAGLAAGTTAYRAQRSSAADAADDDGAREAAVLSPLDSPQVRSGRRVPTRRSVLLGGPAVLAAAGAGGGIALNQLRSGDEAIGRDQILPEAADTVTPLPDGIDLQVPGITPFRTSSADFYRVDIALSTPRLDAASWSLAIDGDVQNPITLSYADLLDMPLIERWITLTCVSNPVGGPYVSTGKWLGVPLHDLLEQVNVRPEASQIFTESADGLTMSVPLAAATDGRDAMLVLGLNDEQLPVERGFPARLIVPGLFGFVSAAKWLTRMKLSSYEEDVAYWTQRSWATDAPVLTQARIDVPGPLERVPSGTVTIAGVAWAQHRGIERVEVQVDDGEWSDAELAADAGVDLWRQWRFAWESTGPGRHDVRVRATDGNGDTQVEERTDPVPDGARGWHSIAFTVRD